MIQFPLNFYLLALVAAAGLSFLGVPLWRDWCHRLGLIDDPGERKIHARPTPLAGGLAVWTGIAVPLVLGAIAVKWQVAQPDSFNLLNYGFSRRGLQLYGIVVGALGMLLLGLADDRWELPPWAKFAGQFLVALLTAMAGIRTSLFVHSVWFSYAITILWILTVTNALNFMDNMNGLCAGLGAISAWNLGLYAAAHGQYLVGLLSFLTAGALLGFLPYNFPGASAFLGDAGSHLVGYLLGVLAILPHFYTRTQADKLAVVSPLLILALPLFDLIRVVCFRLMAGKPFYVGDTNHLSHRLVARGWSKTRAVLFIWLLAAAIGTVPLLLF